LRRLWEIFADILEYPTPLLGKEVDECIAGVRLAYWL
jgi:hypothetical protein